MGDILLSDKKQNRFEKMIERAISNEFDVECSVLVQSNGRVYIRGGEREVDVPSEIVGRDDEVYEVLSGLEFEFEASSYELTDGEEEALVGASFYLKRDGW